LGRPDVVIEGVDLKLHDQPEAYRQAVDQIKYDLLSLGALVTTHKIDLLEAARDLFDYLDPYAVLCGEVSSISKLDGRLEGHAKDPISSGKTLDRLLGPGYFGRTGGEVLCFGAGGSAVATALHLINKPEKADRPSRLIVVNRSQGRLDHMRGMVESLGTDIRFDYICNSDPSRNDATLAELPPRSVVINATGMGKDLPGSPITDAG
jgi:shikimate 5-dehydrogenase